MSKLKEASPNPYMGQETPAVSSRTNYVKNPSSFEVFNACVNDLTGRDKLAKVTQYFIRLLNDCNNMYGLGNPKVRSKFDTAGVGAQANMPLGIDINTDVKFKKLHPIIKSFNILSQISTTSTLNKSLLLLLSFLTKRLSFLLEGLNIYRHVLRMGTVPFRVWRFVNHIRYSLRILMDRSKLESTAMRVEKVVKYWTTKDMFSQIINFWYAISDEILLLFRFKILLTKKEGGTKVSDALFTWSEDHELYSWMALILNGLYNDWNKWLILKDKESRIILNQKVKARTMKIVGDLKKKNNIYVEDELVEFDQNYIDQLDQVRYEIRTIYINSVRLTCDMVFDAKYIFNWNMYKPLHTSLGMFSGLLGTVNSWRSQREKLKNSN